MAYVEIIDKFSRGSIVKPRKTILCLLAYDDIEFQKKRSPVYTRFAGDHEIFTVIDKVKVKIKLLRYSKLWNALYVMDMDGRLCTVRPESVVKVA